MKKVFWSAFAMSLIILSAQGFAQSEAIDGFLGLENEILPELRGEQKFTSPDFHEASSELHVVPENVIKDVSIPTRGQKYSIIPWERLDPNEWMDISTWIREREIKDKIPDWKLRLRLDEHKELVGKVLQCRGKCYNYRGSEKARVNHLSRLHEGDEIHTEKDSVAWIFMMDGSLLRLAPGSSLSFQEVNLTKSDFFFLLRLNAGHIFWHPRTKGEVPVELGPETDSLSLPLMIRKANQQYFERKRFLKQADEEHLSEVMEFEEGAIKSQFAEIAEMREKNNSFLTMGTKVMVVAPNLTIVGKNTGFDMVYVAGGKSYFKKKTSSADEEFSLHLRGYSNTETIPISSLVWHEVEMSGRTFTTVENVPGDLQILELITKRIKTFELAREYWIKDFTAPLIAKVDNPEILAREEGFHLWGEEHGKRLSFLMEYTRRVETTHLRSLENLLLKLEKNGETVKRELSEDLYRVSLNNYLLGLKSRYDNKKMQVREMNDLQYYVWILKNGKF